MRGCHAFRDAAEVYERCFVPAILASGRRTWLMLRGWHLKIACWMSVVELECLPGRLPTASQRKAR
jgi:hypothetical protein